jgi:hypothetical protein
VSDERELRAALEKAQAALKKTRAELEQAKDDQGKSEDELEATRHQLREAKKREDALALDLEHLKLAATPRRESPAPQPRRPVSSDTLARVAIMVVVVLVAGMGVRAFIADAAGLGAALIGVAAILAFNARRG